MCKFFSFVTNPDHDKDFYYFDWQMRQSEKDGADSHSHICAHFKLNEDKCNKYEYNPLAKKFAVDMQNAEHDDRIRAKRWVESLDWKLIVKPLIVKPIVSPFKLPKVEKPTDEQVSWLKEWDSVWDSARASARDYVSTLFKIEYKLDFTSAVKLWEAGLVPSYDRTVWRLHTGTDAHVVYEWKPEKVK